MCVMNKLFGLTVLCLVISFGTMAQNTRSTTVPVTPRPAYQSAKKKQKKGMFAFLKKEKPKNEVADLRDRLQKVYKQKAKEEKKMEKPQYSNPSYFGHKRPPKKRPVGKQKFCKVCKIKH